MEEMRKVQETDAQANFSDLIQDVERGEAIAITRNGKDVAALVPFDDAERERRRRTVENFFESRRKRGKIEVSTEEIFEFINEGRRF